MWKFLTFGRPEVEQKSQVEKKSILNVRSHIFFHRQCWYAKKAANRLNGLVEQLFGQKLPTVTLSLKISAKMVEKTFRKKFLEFSLFLTLFPSDFHQNCPAHSPRTVEQYCGPRPNRPENSEASYEVMFEKKLKTEKSRFFLKK